MGCCLLGQEQRTALRLQWWRSAVTYGIEGPSAETKKAGEQHRKCAHMRGVSANSIDCLYMTSLQALNYYCRAWGEGSITELLTAQLVLHRQKGFHQSYHPEVLALTGTSIHLQLFHSNFAFDKEIKY